MPGELRSASVRVDAAWFWITSCGMTCTDLGVSSKGAVNLVEAESLTSYGTSASPCTCTGVSCVTPCPPDCACAAGARNSAGVASTAASDPLSDVTAKVSSDFNAFSRI
ncbi:Uncharacterised protein [Achromobacter xylosoxidans]|nr:Uncharacterised protein [Achromobacter xylosoxidans]